MSSRKAASSANRSSLKLGMANTYIPIKLVPILAFGCTVGKARVSGCPVEFPLNGSLGKQFICIVLAHSCSFTIFKQGK